MRRFFCFVSADPGYTSNWVMHVFSVTFMHVLERQVADSWALAEGKHHPVGQVLFVQCGQLTFGFLPGHCSPCASDLDKCDGSSFLACGLLLEPFGTRRYVLPLAYILY